MEKRNLEKRLLQGSPSIVQSTPFSVIELRKLAKAALRGGSMLTIKVGEELNDHDIDSILMEAPSNVAFDYSCCKF